MTIEQTADTGLTWGALQLGQFSLGGQGYEEEPAEHYRSRCEREEKVKAIMHHEGD